MVNRDLVISGVCASVVHAGVLVGVSFEIDPPAAPSTGLRDLRVILAPEVVTPPRVVESEAAVEAAAPRVDPRRVPDAPLMESPKHLAHAIEHPEQETSTHERRPLAAHLSWRAFDRDHVIDRPLAIHERALPPVPMIDVHAQLPQDVAEPSSGPVSEPSAHPTSTRPEALSNPKPAYPALARRRGYEGVVELRVEVRADGLPGEIIISRSSGYGILDRAAVAAVRKWRFTPATIRGHALASEAVVPIEFKLDGT